ncbi:hypothetical protein OB236_32460 [Paenibacillus sp. WQ 127069]|uniref:Tyrosine protein kinase n=1 Tax=Paenibacillus baimaensis TaxID=2982185 RepID=A0ABT2UQB2_9BACL|nr:hypothetical protein [Paenibacillus sp. WQ 127069]MCU6796849.1 hypothetical protein [Paenibacillus sp. WQ 127069]
MSIQRPPIGNRGVNTRSFTQQPPSYSLGTQLPNPYPGIGTNSYTPQPQYTPQVVQAAPTPPASGGGGALSKLTSFFGGGGSTGSGAAAGAGSAINIAQMKQIFDRLGGIDGIMDTMGKVQKMVQSVQQMAPLVKVLMGSFGKKKKDGDSDAPLRRRRRKRTNGKNTSKSRGKRRKAR